MNIFELENKYKHILENIEEWNYLRIYIGNYLNNSKNEVHKVSILEKIHKFKKFKNIFYGFKNWFKSYDCLFVSDSSQRKEINNIYYHRFFDSLVDVLNNKKILLIEQPVFNHYNNIKHKTVVSEVFLKLLNNLHSKIFKNKYKKNHLIDIKKILKKEKINFNIEEKLAYFHMQYILYKQILKIYKPKKIFLTCYYCRFGLVKAANELNIPIIEFQHGVISKEHFGYISELNVKNKNNYLPQYLLSFGEREKDLKYILIQNIIPIGSYYLEYLMKNFIPNQHLQQIVKNYKIVVGISMQDEEWERKFVFDFLQKVCDLNDNILYIIIPRRNRNFPDFHKNVIVYDKLNCYNTIMHCDIHMTLYSSCALESPSLGIPNILLNLKNIAYDYYFDFLGDKYTKYIINEKEMYNVINELITLNKTEVIELNKKNFKLNYMDNLKQFLKTNIDIR